MKDNLIQLNRTDRDLMRHFQSLHKLTNAQDSQVITDKDKKASMLKSAYSAKKTYQVHQRNAVKSKAHQRVNSKNIRDLSRKKSTISPSANSVKNFQSEKNTEFGSQEDMLSALARKRR